MEILDMRRDVVQVIFDDEVTSVETMDLGLREVGQVRIASFGREQHVALSPKNERFRLTLAQELLPLGVQRNVGAIVVEQVEVQARRVWPLQECNVRGPGIGTHELRAFRAMQIDRLDRFRKKKSEERLLR